MKERYKQIAEFPNYEVSNLGNVRNISRGSVLKSFKGTVELSKENKSYKKQVAQLVLEAFRGIKFDTRNIRVEFINGRSCALSNLRVVTMREAVSKIWAERKKHTTSKFMGVCKDRKSGLWKARIWHSNKSHNLGLFSDELDAYNAYVQAKESLVA